MFTEHLIGGLCGGVASDDGLVRIFDLFEYLQPRVTKQQPQQHPLFKGELEENFPVALYRGGIRGVVPSVEGEFRYDAYISYLDQGADAEFVWQTLVPKLESAGLKIAVSGDSAEPGVPRIVGGERAIRQAKRTIVVLSEAYLADSMADFENVLGQTMSIQEGSYRLLPVKIAPIAADRLPVRLGMLETLDLTNPRRADRSYERLIRAYGPAAHEMSHSPRHARPDDHAARIPTPLRRCSRPDCRASPASLAGLDQLLGLLAQKFELLPRAHVNSGAWGGPPGLA